MKDRLYFVTGNDHKAAMFREVMEPEFQIEQLEPREEIQENRSQDVNEVIADKLAQARRMFPDQDGFLFVTDVGFSIEGLDGTPGALIKRLTKERFDGDFAQWVHALDEDDSRDATIHHVIGAENTDADRFFVEHRVDGHVPEEPKIGGKGFAWDKIFVPDWEQYGKDLDEHSFDQVEPEDKFAVLFDPIIEAFKQRMMEHQSG